MSSMEFWGVEVKAGEPLKVEPKDFCMIHLSQAALGESKKGRESVPLFVKVNEKKIVLGTLSPENIPQLSFDLVFETEFELSHNWKNGSVFFCGYQVIPDDDASEFSSDEEDFEFAKAAMAKVRTILTRMMSQKRVCLLMKIWMIRRLRPARRGLMNLQQRHQYPQRRQKQLLLKSQMLRSPGKLLLTLQREKLQPMATVPSPQNLAAISLANPVRSHSALMVP
ncbi:HISTONE DEACETYLASE HDT3-LIKE ISOFORM X1 [Salix koriyanagi]|uniref:HISTONE DEACETYLASE HDT3-LIKE ISOFORM X1 n=1 Tax=Salix koriyanagi TaxID=2511006 RepID=A0A9Q0TSP9_9ROSI|nr:HISTONE DEACETYLASE HDT3-LIKE ISOFORM X1 [Salix koriyanagi]